MARVVHFEFTADDPERASRFWTEAFGWSINRWDAGDYWLVGTGEGVPGIDGAIMPHIELDPAPGAMVTVQVDSLGESIEKIRSAGGTVLTDPRDIPGVGSFVHCRDTEGTLFTVMEAAAPEG